MREKEIIIPIQELPGCVQQGESPAEHHFTLLTTDHYYGEETASPLRKFGFSFTPDRQNPALLRKTGNPDRPMAIDTICDLMRLVNELGPVVITRDQKLAFVGYAHLPNIEPVDPSLYPGYTSVWSKEK